MFQEQAQFGFLLSDPLGDGSDYWTASAGIDFGLIGATEVWYVQVAALVIGHVAGLTLAHDRALSLYRDPRSAAQSQYWMLAVMIAFTCLGLFRSRRRTSRRGTAGRRLCPPMCGYAAGVGTPETLLARPEVSALVERGAADVASSCPSCRS